MKDKEEEEIDDFLEDIAELLNRATEAKRKAQQILNERKPLLLVFLMKIYKYPSRYMR